MPTSFPQKGRPKSEVLRELRSLQKDDADWQRGRCFAYVYQARDELNELLREAYQLYAKANAVNPGAFPGIKRMERQLIEMAAELFHLPAQDPAKAGTFTSGGSESILLAVLAAREHFRQKRPGKQGEIILSATAHPTFHKAAHYFDLKIVQTPVNSAFKTSPEAVQAQISENTALIVASAPSFPQGIIDPIEELGQIALQHDIPMHVDACVGGFILPFLKRGGVELPDFDFSVPGVTSLSADLHKYGYADKGASLVLFRDSFMRRNSFFTFTSWTGGLYGSTHITGSRSGGPVAAAWALLQHLGMEGYTRLAMQAYTACRQMLRGIEQFPELQVLGRPQATLFALASDSLNVYELADELSLQGWYIDRQQSPPSLHFNITAAHETVVEPFLQDLAKAIEKSKKRSGGFRQKWPLHLVNGLQRLLPETLFSKLRHGLASRLSVPKSGSRSAPLYGMTESLKKSGQLDELIKDLLE